MSDLNTEIKLTASADGVETGVARAKRSLQGLKEEAKRTGDEGGKGMAPLGDGADAAARKVESATRSMQNSLQRQIAALEAGGTATRQYQESLAKLRGVDANAIKPLLDQLDAAKRKADGAGQGLLGLGSASGLLQGQLAALAGSLTLGSMAAFVLQINNGIDALNDIKDATGSTIENISALEDVGKRTGASLDLVGGILIKFNDVLSKAGPKSDIALQLQAIGLSAEELKRLDPAEALLRTAQALQQYADDGNKARLVQDLFGKSVKDAAPFLNDLAAKGELVAKVTSQQAEEAEKFNKELFAMQANIQDASRRLAGPLVTAINEVAEAFRKGSAEGKGFWENASDRYWSNVRGFYGMQQPGSRSVSGTITNAPGYTDAPAPADRPSVGPVRTAAEIAAAEAAARAAAQRAAEARKRELAEQAKFYADLSGLSADYYDKLARAQKERATGNISEAQYVEYVEQLIQKQPFATALTRDNAAALKAQATAAIEAAKASAAYYGAIGQDLTRLDEQNERLRQEGEQIGLTAEGLLALTLARQDHAIAIESERLSLLQANEGSAEEIILQQRRIALLKEQRTLTATNGQRQIAADAAKAAASEWERASQQIEQALTDALMRGFESGKGFAAVLRDTVVNMFKTMVLRPVIQATVQGGLNAVGLGGASGGGGLLGTANNAYSAYNAITGMGGIASSAGIISGATYGTTALSSQSMMLAAQEAGFGAAGVGAAGNIGAVLSNPATIALGAVLAISAIHKATKGETRYGGQYGYNFGDGLADYRRGGEFAGATLGVNRITGAETLAEAEVQAAITGTVGGINALLKAAGSSAALVGFQAGLETSGKGRGGVFSGGTLSTGATFGEDGSGDNYAGTLFEKTSTQSPDAETALKNFALDLQQATVQALQAATDIPESLKKLVQGVDAEALTADTAAALLSTVQAQISAVEQLNTVFGSIGWETLATGAYDATVALAEASGGFDALAQNLAGYNSNFYSQAEQQARATDTLTTQLAALGQTLPSTRDGFRALVESAEKAGDTALLAGLLALQDEFAALVPSADAAAKAIKDTAQAVADAAAKAATDARSAALAQLDASVQRERTLWQQQATAAASLRDEVRGVFDTLATSISELRADALGPALSAAQGQAFITSAIAAVGAGAGLPDGTGLANAISAARGGLSAPGAFANSAEQQFAALRLAGELALLQEAAGEQLSTADRQLAAAESQIEQLDQTLSYWRTQLDDNQAAIDATLSVASAVDALRALMAPSQSAAAAAAATSTGAAGQGGFVVGGGSGGATPGRQNYGGLNDVQTVFAGSYARSLEWGTPEADAASTATLAAYAQSNNITQADLADVLGFTPEQVRDHFERYGIPAFDQGINLVPYDMTARIHKGEAVVPAVFNPFNPAAPGGGNAEVVAELRAMRSENATLRALFADMALHTQRTAEATNGRPDRPMPVETV